MVTRTVSIPELIFTILAFIGVITNTRVAWRALVAFIGIRVLRINSIREYAAITTLSMFLTFVVIQSLLLAIGLNSMALPNIKPINLQVVLNTVAFIVMELLMVGVAVMTDIRRAILARKIMEIEKGLDE